MEKKWFTAAVRRFGAAIALCAPYLIRDGNLDVAPTQSAATWRDLNVDVAYVQPNYYFQADRPYKYLTQTIAFADNNDMGLELEFEGYSFWWSQSGGRVRNTPSNCGLYSVSPTFYQRFVDYIDAFEDASEFDFAPMSYYSGFQGIYDFENGVRKDKELINRLAVILNKRHIMTGWDKTPVDVSGINNVEIDNRVLAYGVEGAIYIAKEGIESAAIYSIDGSLLYSNDAIACGDSELFGVTVPCDRGLYIVRVGGKAIKVIVK